MNPATAATALVGTLVLTACGGGTVPVPREAPSDPPGCIAFDQTRMSIGSVVVQDGHIGSATVEIPIRNPCEGVLHVHDVLVEGTIFRLSGFTSGPVFPGTEEVLVVSFHPDTAGEFEAALRFATSDWDRPVSWVNLDATAIAPRLDVPPSPLDVGEPAIGCPVQHVVPIRNVGNVDLVVEDVRFVDRTSDELGLDLRTDRYGPLPFTIPPTDPDTGRPVVEIFIDYRALDRAVDAATLDLVSTDPFEPTVRRRISAMGTRVERVVDTFARAERAQLDLLFTVDRSSGGMWDANTALIEGFPAFPRVLGEADVDYQIAVAAADDGCVLGPNTVIDATFSASEAAAAFETMVDIDMVLSSYGSNTERGFMLAEAALQPSSTGRGGCNEGLLREGGQLATMHLSNEPEQSAKAWSHYVALFQSLKDDPDDFVSNAVAGDYPTGCGSASPGSGYWEATVATGGAFRSICEPDWASYARAIVDASVRSVRRYPLSERPVPETLAVWVNGELRDAGWSYSVEGNSIEFEASAAPPTHAWVDVMYDLAVDCEE